MKMGIIKNNECAYNVLYMLYVEKLWLYTSKLFSKLGERVDCFDEHKMCEVGFKLWKCLAIDVIVLMG